jgi:hypothetical protein
MIKYLKQYADKTFEELVNGLIWFDLPLRLKAIFAKLPTGGGDSRPYKVYTALLTQTGTDAPVATVLENTLGEIVWSYGEIGIYLGTLNSAFVVDKTYITTTSTESGEDSSIYPILSTAPTVNFCVIRTSAGINSADNYLKNTPIEIRVYN